MTVAGWLEIALFLAVLTELTPLLGGFIARVFRCERVLLTPILAPVVRVAYRALGVDSDAGQDWKRYARSVLILSAVFALVLYAILRTQSIHPWNPRDLGSGASDV